MKPEPIKGQATYYCVVPFCRWTATEPAEITFTMEPLQGDGSVEFADFMALLDEASAEAMAIQMNQVLVAHLENFHSLWFWWRYRSKLHTLLKVMFK